MSHVDLLDVFCHLHGLVGVTRQRHYEPEVDLRCSKGCVTGSRNWVAGPRYVMLRHVLNTHVRVVRPNGPFNGVFWDIQTFGLRFSRCVDCRLVLWVIVYLIEDVGLWADIL